ncbi:MAG: hypothetical protein N3G20_07760 [Verrucomicrobiae bacterium]|nr:hypothetical protein [Verrucomicrobiae bacterium]
MKFEDILRIQAWVDGRLSASEARHVEELIRTDAEARSVATELRWIKAAFAGGEVERKVPESREFYWSKIQRAIIASGAVKESRPVRRWERMLRWLVPAGIAAALGFLVFLPLFDRNREDVWISGAEIESPLSDVSSITFRSELEGVTVVWISTH